MIVRLDMSEYMERHSVSKMIGSPPGYVGFEEGGQLTEIVRRKPFSVILLDEIEKAHPDIFNALLQIMEDGRLTDSKGRTVNFKNTIIILTSNIGSDLLRQSEIGFGKENGKKKALAENETERIIQNALREKFRPEFLNRLDEIVIFTNLSKKEIGEIVSLELEKTQKLLNEHNVKLNVDEKAKKYLVEKGLDEEYGARPLKRLIQKEIENPLSSKLISGELEEGAVATISSDGKALKLKVESKVPVLS